MSLDTDPRWYQRGLKEAIYITAKDPQLNKDKGRHPLPRAYKKLTESCDLSEKSVRSRDSISAPGGPVKHEVVQMRDQKNSRHPLNKLYHVSKIAP